MRERDREYLANVCKYIKLKPFCVELGINLSNVSTFIKYGSHAIGDDRIHELVLAIRSYAEKIA